MSQGWDMEKDYSPRGFEPLTSGVPVGFSSHWNAEIIIVCRRGHLPFQAFAFFERVPSAPITMGITVTLVACVQSSPIFFVSRVFFFLCSACKKEIGDVCTQAITLVALGFLLISRARSWYLSTFSSSVVRIFWAAGTAMLIIVSLLLLLLLHSLTFIPSNSHDQPRQKIRHSLADNKNSPEDQSQAKFSWTHCTRGVFSCQCTLWIILHW